MRSSETAENRKWAKIFSSRLKFFVRHIDFSASDWARSRVLTYPHSNDLWRWINSLPFRRFYVSCQKDILKIFKESNLRIFLVLRFKIGDNCVLSCLGTRIILPSNTSPVIHNRRRSRNRKCFLFDSTSFRPAPKFGNRVVPSSPSLFSSRAKLICWTAWLILATLKQCQNERKLEVSLVGGAAERACDLTRKRAA